VSLSEGFLFKRGRQREVPPEKTLFANIGSYSVKTVADRAQTCCLS